MNLRFTQCKKQFFRGSSHIHFCSYIVPNNTLHNTVWKFKWGLHFIFLETLAMKYFQLTRPCFIINWIQIFLVKPRRTRKEELQEAARQKAAAALAQRNRLYGGQHTDVRKHVVSRRSRGSSLSKTTTTQNTDQERRKTVVKAAGSAASNPLEGQCWINDLKISKLVTMCGKRLRVSETVPLCLLVQFLSLSFFPFSFPRFLFKQGKHTSLCVFKFAMKTKNESRQQ